MYDVFISYSRTDQVYAQSLVGELRRRGFQVWIDESIEHGHTWFAEIEKAILDSRSIIVIMTPAAEKSEWVHKEILLAKREQKPIFPLLLQGREFGILIDMQYGDVRGDRLPPDTFFQHVSQVVFGTTRKTRKPPAAAPSAPLPPTVPSIATRKEVNKSGGKNWLTCGVIAAVVLLAACGVVSLFMLDAMNALNTSLNTIPLNIDPQSQTRLENQTSENQTVVGHAASNAGHFLTFLGQGNFAQASQYVCPSSQAWLAQTAANALLSLGIMTINNVNCVSSGDSRVTCSYTGWTAAGVAMTLQDSFIIDNGLVCDIATF